MKPTIQSIYFSPNGTTQKIIKTITNELGIQTVHHNLTQPKNRDLHLTVNQDDIAIFAFPVYGGRIPKLLIQTLNQIKGHQTKAIFIVTYGNRDYEDALLELKDLCEANGFIGIAAATFIAEHSATQELATKRPNLEDLSIASHFAKQLLPLLNPSSHRGTLTVPGNRPYVVKQLSLPPITPQTSDDCINCGICAKHCPMEAIDFNNVKVIDSTTCIKCRSCVKKCPVAAKAIEHPAYQNMQRMLKVNFAHITRKPELFYQRF